MNEEENLNPEMNEQNSGNQQELEKDAKSNATNTKVVKAGAKAVANAYAPGVGGKVVDIASQTKIGNDILNAGGQALTGATKAMPFGDKLQDTLNKADDAGAVDMASNALDAAGGGGTGAAGGGAAAAPEGSAASPLNSLSSSPLGGESDSSSSLSGDKSSGLSSLPIPGMTPKGPMKYWTFYAIGAAVLVILICILMLPHTTLDLTAIDRSNNTVSTDADNVNTLSNTQIEDSLIYVGDSRVVELESSLDNDNINYIAESDQGYHWFKESGINELSASISNNTQKKVVIGLGVNDLASIDNYIAMYNYLSSNYSNVDFYFMSVNPVNEELTSKVTNSQIEEFNRKLSGALGDRYIDVYSGIKDSFETEDGIHYSAETNQKIHDITLDHIKQNSIITFLDKYPNVKESKSLQGMSITAAIGQSGVEKLNSYIETQINLSGKCTGAGVAWAAAGLINNLHEQGYHIEYYWNDRVDYNSNKGINLTWGTTQGTKLGTENVYYYSGMDSSSFVSWAMNTAGVSAGTTTDLYASYGPSITYAKTSPGDLLVSSSHVVIVIENKNTYLQCAEATIGGVQFTTKTEEDLITYGYKVIDMDEYYENNCKDL